MGKHWAKSVDAEMQIPSKTIELKSDGLRNAYHLTPCASVEYKSGTSVRQPYGLKMYAELIRRCLKSAQIANKKNQSRFFTALPMLAEKLARKDLGLGVKIVKLKDIENMPKKTSTEYQSKGAKNTQKTNQKLSLTILSAITELRLSDTMSCLARKMANAKYAINIKVNSKEDLMLTTAIKQEGFAACFA